jgi:hypothetical protein
VQELFAPRTTHESVVSGYYLVLEAEPLENTLIRVPMLLIRDFESGIRVIKRIAVFHRELATSKEASARPRLVPVLVLDLINVKRQILVRAVQVLHEKREHLLVCRSEQVVGSLSVLEPEDPVAVGYPPAALLVRFPGQ